MTFGQSSEHLTFKGVPIDGTLDDFVSNMEKSGFSHLGTNKGSAVLEGDFATYKGCQIYVSTLNQIDLVNLIGVIFPKKDTWSNVLGDYTFLKKLLSEKYGEPGNVVEEFRNGDPSSDFLKVIKIGQQEGTYRCVWELDKGSIVLSIIPSDSKRECSSLLVYSDKINADKVKEKALDDL